MRTLDRHDREAQQGPNVVVLCLDERYPKTLAHWLRSTGVRVEIVESGRQTKQLLHTGERWVLVTDRVPPPLARPVEVGNIEKIPQAPPDRGDRPR